MPILLKTTFKKTLILIQSWIGFLRENKKFFMKKLLYFFAIFTRFCTAEITVPGALTHEQRAQPKQVIQGSIPIQNGSEKAALVKISLADYLFNSKGESFFPSSNSHARSNASWINMGETQVTVEPSTTYHFSYTLSVPDDPALAGTYWSIFLIEQVEDPLKDPEKEKALGIQTIIRYGVQVITHVGDKGVYELKILDKKLSKEGDTSLFSISVENLGTQMQTPLFLLELMNAQGKKEKRLEAPKQRILPTCSVTYTVDLSSVPQGKYKALALFDDSEDAFFGAQYDLTVE